MEPNEPRYTLIHTDIKTLLHKFYITTYKQYKFVKEKRNAEYAKHFSWLVTGIRRCECECFKSCLASKRTHWQDVLL